MASIIYVTLPSNDSASLSFFSPFSWPHGTACGVEPCRQWKVGVLTLDRRGTPARRPKAGEVFSPDIGSKELEVIVCRQRVQLLFQLLLGEAGGKPPDDHLEREVASWIH